MTRRVYDSLPRELADGLRSLDWRVRALAVLKGSGVFIAVAGGSLAAGLFVDWLIDLGVAVRTGMLIGVAAAAVATLAAAIVRPLLRRPSASELAALVDAANPQLGERIESAVELTDADLPARHRGSSFMRSQLLRETAGCARSIDFRKAAETSPAFRWIRGGALVLLLLLAPFGLTREGYGLLLARFFSPWRNLDRATNLYFHIEKGDRFVGRGSDVTIVAEPRWRVYGGRLPDHAWLRWQTDGAAADARRMELDPDSGTYRVTLPHVLAAFDYDVAADRARTRTYRIEVVEAPAIERLRLSIEPPAYTGRPARVIDGPAGRIEVFARSRLVFELRFSKPLAAAELHWLPRNGDEPHNGEIPSRDLPLPVVLGEAGRSGALTLVADDSGLLHFALRDLQGVKNVDTSGDSPLELVVVADEPPAVHWMDIGRSPVESGEPLEVRPSDRVPLPVLASDDVGVDELELHAAVLQRNDPLSPLAADGRRLGGAVVEHTFLWDLSSLALREGDLLSVRARAVDGRPVPGPQETWTDPRIIRISGDTASIERSLLTQQQKRLRDILESVRENVRQDRTSTDALRKTVRETPKEPLPPEHQRQIDELVNRGEQLIQKLDQLAAVFAGHPLLRNIAPATRAVGSDPLAAARQRFQQAATASVREQLEPLTNGADELARADEQLGQLLDRFDELAALEQDLQRLQTLSEDAERLAGEVAEFEQQWEQMAREHEPATPEKKALQEALSQQHSQLSDDQQALTSALDQLLDERPEVLQAAAEHERERLQQLSELASRLADRERRLADAISNTSAEESESSVPPPDQTSESSQDPVPQASDPAAASPESPDVSPPPPLTADSDEPPRATETPADLSRRSETEEKEPQPTSDLAELQQRVAEQAARLALETARNRGMDAPATQRARQFAESALGAAEDARTGLMQDAAENAQTAAESARQTAETFRDPIDPAPAPLREQAATLADQQAALAEQLRQRAESPTALREAQAAGQRHLAEQTDALTEQLRQLAERWGAEPLEDPEQSERAASAQQSAAQARQQMESAREELEQGRPQAAAPQARAAAEALQQSSQRAGELSAENPPEEPSPVPGEVGEQVADARRRLQQAGEQLERRARPPASPAETESLDDSQNRESPEDAETPPGQQPSKNEEIARNEPQDENSERPAPTDPQQRQEGEPQSPQPADQDPSQSMRQVAESLRQAARQLGMHPSPSDQKGKPGDEEGEPSDGTPGSQSGNSGDNPISLVELEAELKRMSSRNWGQLPGRIESDLFQSTQKKPDGDYARLIRLYFEEISRRRSADENLAPNDNDL